MYNQTKGIGLIEGEKGTYLFIWKDLINCKDIKIGDKVSFKHAISDRTGADFKALEVKPINKDEISTTPQAILKENESEIKDRLAEINEKWGNYATETTKGMTELCKDFEWLMEQAEKAKTFEIALKKISNLPVLESNLSDAQYLALLALEDEDI